MTQPGLNFSPRMQRALAIAILLLVVVLVWRVAIGPFVTGTVEHHHAVAAARETLLRYQAIKAHQPELEKRLAEFRDQEGAVSSFIEVGSIPQASLSLQIGVKGLIENNGGKIVSSQIIQDQKKGEFHQIGVRMEFTAYVGELQRILYDIEFASPYYFIETMSVLTTGNNYGGQNERDTILAVQVEVSSYAKDAKEGAK